MSDEITNWDRAGYARAALDAYAEQTRDDGTFGDEDSEEFVEVFSDLLGDLHHLARRAGADFNELLASGYHHFQHEVAEETALERQKAAEATAPRDARMYAALTEEFQPFSAIREKAGLEPRPARFSLLRLMEEGKAEAYPGEGWRLLTVPPEERVRAALREREYVFLSSLEVDLKIEESRLRAVLLGLEAAGEVEATKNGWHLKDTDDTEVRVSPTWLDGKGF